MRIWDVDEQLDDRKIRMSVGEGGVAFLKGMVKGAGLLRKFFFP